MADLAEELGDRLSIINKHKKSLSEKDLSGLDYLSIELGIFLDSKRISYFNMSSHNLEGTHLAYVDCLNEWVEKFILPDRPSLSIRKDKSIQDQSKFSSTLK